MLKKFSVLMLLMLMTTVITLKHPVLGYCLCLESYFTADSLCDSSKPAPSAANTTADHASCCSTSKGALNSFTSDHPCDDCTELLLVDVGEFLWDGNTENLANEPLISSPDYSESHTPNLTSLRPKNAYQTRAGPPESTAQVRSLSLYLKHSVFRL